MSRSRGSWTPRLVGISLVVVLAVAGAIAYLQLAGVARAGRPARQPGGHPGRVAGSQAAGIISQGPPQHHGAGRAPELLLASSAGLAFAAFSQSHPPAGFPEWTVDQMADGTYIAIYISSGRCLASVPSRPGVRSSPALPVRLARCDLSPRERWLRQYNATGRSGRGYWQLRNVADGRCLTAADTSAASAATADHPARLQPCGTAHAWPQLISFLTPY